MSKYILTLVCAITLTTSCATYKSKFEISKNPIIDGWYADPEGAVFGKEYWVFPTYSAKYEEQVFFDAFSSKNLKT